VLFNGYAHVFVLLSVVIVTLPLFGGVYS